MRILIIGAAGFIGSRLVEISSQRDFDIVALSRKNVSLPSRVSWFKWALGEPIPEAAMKDVDVAIYLAHDFDGLMGAETTRDATVAAFTNAAKAGIKRQIFFSSYSAGQHANSVYGRTKYEIETEIRKVAGTIIVRPGLVIGAGGLYGRIQKFAKRLPILVLPEGGKGLIPVIHLDVLCQTTLNLVEAKKYMAEANLFYKEPITLRQLVFNACGQPKKTPWILPAPTRLLLPLITFCELIHLPLPVSADNLKGFIANQHAKHESTHFMESDEDTLTMANRDHEY